MRLRSLDLTTGLLVAATALCGGYLYATRHAPTTRESESRSSNLLKLYDQDKLSEIGYDREGVHFVLRREATDAGEGHIWKIQQGAVVDQADSFAVDRALGSFEFLFPQRVVNDSEVDRHGFGLDAPRARVALKVGDKQTTLTIGGPSPRPDNSVYVEVDGKVSVVKREALATIDLPPDAFRTRTLVPYLSNDLKAMSFAADGSSYTLEKAVATTWKIATGPEAGTRVDRFLLDRMLGAFAEIKADTFVDEATARQAQQGARTITVKMTPTDSKKPAGEFILGGVCPGHPDDIVALRTAPAPLAACTGKGAIEGLDRPAASLVDRRPFTLRDDEIEEISITQGDRRLEIARKEHGWRQRAPVDADVAGDSAKALVKALAGTRAELLGHQAPAGFEVAGKVILRATKENEEARPPEEIELGKEEKDGSVPLRRVQDGAFLRLAHDEARAFLPRTTAVRSTRLINHPIDRIRRIAITGGEAPQSLERSADGVWTMLSPKGYPIDIGVCADLTEALMHLSAEQWVSDRDDGSFGLARPRLRVELTVSGEEAGVITHDLAIGDPGPLGLYGRIDHEEGVFVLPRAFEQTLSTLAIDRTLFVVDTARIEQVSIVRSGEKALILAVQDEKLRVTQGPELTPVKLDALHEALGDLKAEGVVHLGPARKDEGLDHPSLELVVTLTKEAAKTDRVIKLHLGASDAFRSTTIFYARRDGIDATFALPAARVRALLGALP
jgi:hypothetical protein